MYHIKKLHEKKFRSKERQFIVEGVKGVEEALASTADIFCIAIEEARKDEMKHILQLAKKKEIEYLLCGKKDIALIKSVETFPGVLAVVDMPDHDISDIATADTILCLDGISDPGNLGTIIRTADWFGIQAILLSPDCVDPYNEKVVRSTMGSIFHMTMTEAPDLEEAIHDFQKDGYHISGFSLGGKDIQHLKKQEKSVYIFGSESHGIRKDILDMCDSVYTIPGFGKAESLNVGVAVGIVLYHISV